MSKTFTLQCFKDLSSIKRTKQKGYFCRYTPHTAAIVGAGPVKAKSWELPLHLPHKVKWPKHLTIYYRLPRGISTRLVWTRGSQFSNWDPYGQLAVWQLYQLCHNTGAQRLNGVCDHRKKIPPGNRRLRFFAGISLLDVRLNKSFCLYRLTPSYVG